MVADLPATPRHAVVATNSQATFGHRRFPGSASRSQDRCGLPVGSITDDIEQAMLSADGSLAGGGQVDSEELVRRLLGWAERGGNDDRSTCRARRLVRLRRR